MLNLHMQGTVHTHEIFHMHLLVHTCTMISRMHDIHDLNTGQFAGFHVGVSHLLSVSFLTIGALDIVTCL
jgi:hypothetical protein